tara:strand:+ start:1862 stop:2869 length:1008 start_codon:yes stop_codon:yes gene_type:complete
MRRSVMFLLFVFLIFFFFSKNNYKKEYVLRGETMGSIPYTIKFVSDFESVNKNEIDSILISFNNIFSTYIKNSEISKINRSKGKIQISNYFFLMLKKSREIFEETNGAYDPTIGPLVNAWGFGPNKKLIQPSSKKIRDLLNYVGFDKLDFDNESIYKEYQETYIDFSSIAKGYAVDLISKFLSQKGINNYFVEIGGEVKASGLNLSDNYWLVGIEKPIDNLNVDIIATIPLNNLSLATSGNYRNYYESNDSIIYHTIDPKSGYPSNSNMLSASVFAESCMVADAYATAFMVLNFNKSKEILDSSTNLEGFFVYKENGQIHTYSSQNIRSIINLYE